MQLYLSKYRLVSKPFQVNEDGPQELVFNMSNNNDCFLSCLIFIESKTTLLSQFHQCIDSIYLKKKIFIQSKLVICNYLNLEVDYLNLTYSCNGQTHEIILKDSIKETARSEFSYTIIQSNESYFDLTGLKINNFEINTKELSKLKSGLLCRDKYLNINFWVNIYRLRKLWSY